MKKARIVPLIAGAFFFLLITVSPLCAAGDQQPPAEVIKTFNATLLQAMKEADELGYSGRYKLLDPVITKTFAFPFMVSQSVGRYWTKLGEKERSLLLKTYIDWTIATYAGRFDGYSGETFEVVSESKPQRGTVTVLSKLRRKDGEAIDFYYRMRKSAGEWRIVDILISGVSQLALTKAQFEGVLKDKGFEGLISTLDRKIEDFSRTKD